MLLLPCLSFAEEQNMEKSQVPKFVTFLDERTYAIDEIELVVANKDITLALQYNAVLGIELDTKKKLALLLSPISFKVAFENRSSTLTSLSAGGGLSYNIYRWKNNKHVDIDVEATVRQTLSGIIGWDYTEYSIWFKKITNKFGSKTKSGGIGYRYLVSHTNGINDLHCVYLSYSFWYVLIT